MLFQPSGVRPLTSFFQLGPPALRMGKNEKIAVSSTPFPESGPFYITQNVDVVGQFLEYKILN